MPNYQNGKIYKIYCNETGDVYYGSTIQPISARITQHRSKCKYQCSSKTIIDRGNYSYSLVESFPCNSKEELHSRERYWIENNNCINKIIPCRTRKEYREDNKEIISKKLKKWREDNKDKIKEYKSEVIKCECGTNIMKVEKARHKRSAKHKYYLKHGKLPDIKGKQYICDCGNLYTVKHKERHERTLKHQKYLESLN